MAVKLLKLEEFIPVFDKALTDVVSGTYDDLLEGVRIFDKEGNGTVMGAELRHVLRTLGIFELNWMQIKQKWENICLICERENFMVNI